jgi:hypothetical protein
MRVGARHPTTDLTVGLGVFIAGAGCGCIGRDAQTGSITHRQL